MARQRIKNITKFLATILGSAAMLAVIDGVIYLLRTVIYAIISFVLIVIQFLWNLHKNLVLDILYGMKYREMGQSWHEMFTPEDVWRFMTVALIAYYCFSIIFYAYTSHTPPEETIPENHEIPENVSKIFKRFMSCCGILILIIISGFIWFMCYVVGGCD